MTAVATITVGVLDRCYFVVLYEAELQMRSEVVTDLQTHRQIEHGVTTKHENTSELLCLCAY